MKWFYRETRSQGTLDSKAKTLSEAIGKIKQQFEGQKTTFRTKQEGKVTILTAETEYEIIEFEIWEG